MGKAARGTRGGWPSSMPPPSASCKRCLRVQMMRCDRACSLCSAHVCVIGHRRSSCLHKQVSRDHMQMSKSFEWCQFGASAKATSQFHSVNIAYLPARMQGAGGHLVSQSKARAICFAILLVTPSLGLSHAQGEWLLTCATMSSISDTLSSTLTVPQTCNMHMYNTLALVCMS